MKPATPTLLYIDDDAGLARLVDRGLTRAGFKVVHAAGGEQGLARLAQGGIDVVALDQYMPGLDGLETLERIMAIPNAPPVVFVTASQDSAIAVTALKAGAADYLVKDVRGDFIPLLQVAVNGALRQAELQRARDEAEAEVHRSRDRYAALAAEREVLLREVNHRVGNSLQIIASLLHLQANSTTQDDVKAALTNAMGRVAAVAQVHRRLYTSHDLKSVLLNQYLEALLEDLRRSAEGNRMSRLTLKAEPIEIDPDRAVAIGIIVNELVMNAVKYAYPDGAGPIHVELKAEGERHRGRDCGRRRRPQRQGRPALHRHGTTHRERNGRQAGRQCRARSEPSRHQDRAALPPHPGSGAEIDQRRGGLSQSARRRRFDRARSSQENVGRLDRATRAQPVSDGRERNRSRRLAVRRPDPGRKRLRSLHQADITQIVAAAARKLDLAEHGRRIGSVGAKSCFVGEHDLARLRRRHGSQYRHPCAADAQRTPHTDLDRQYLDRIAADATRHAQGVEPGAHRQKQRIAELRRRRREMRLGCNQQWRT